MFNSEPCFSAAGEGLGLQKPLSIENVIPHLLVPTLCRADLGWIFYFGPANSRKIAGGFLSEFWWRILIANCSALFFQGFRPPQKFTPKIHVQNRRHSSPISLSWTQNLFTAIFCLHWRPTFNAVEIWISFSNIASLCVSRWTVFDLWPLGRVLVGPIPGIFPGCPGPMEVFEKFVQRRNVHIFRPLKRPGLSAQKSQRFLRFAIAMPIADPRNRAISETRESNAALRFKGAMESC